MRQRSSGITEDITTGSWQKVHPQTTLEEVGTQLEVVLLNQIEAGHLQIEVKADEEIEVVVKEEVLEEIVHVVNPNITQIEILNKDITIIEEETEKTIENYDSSYVDLKYESTKSIHIIFDINGTLGSLTKNAVYTETGKIINYRPYIEKLIELQEHGYEIGIWSSATFKNVRQQIIEIYKKGNLTKKW
eukprot:UN22354